MKKNEETSEKLTPMMEQYFSIKKQTEGYLLFYRMGDFYEMFFDDAVKASAALDITLTKRGKKNGQDIPMCGVPVHSHESYLARLIRQGFKVAICEQTEDPAEARRLRGTQALVNRDVIRLITPGTLTEDNLLNAGDSNHLVAVSDGKKSFGLSWTDMSTGAFHVQSVSKQASVLSSALSRLNPEEILVSEKLMKNPEIHPVLNEWKKTLTLLPDSRFSFENAQKRLEDFFRVQTLDAFGNFEPQEISSAGTLLDYIFLTQKGRLPRLNPLKKISSSAIMEIDSATRRNLEIFSSLSSEHKHTLYATINQTVTGAGSRLLGGYLSAPLTDVARINRRLDRIDFFVHNPLLRANLRDILRTCPDIERALSRLSLNRGSPRDLGALRTVLELLPNIVELFNQQENSDGLLVGKMPDALKECVSLLGKYDDLYQTLSSALSDDLPFLARDGGFIARGYSDELDELKQLRDESRSLMAKLQSKYIEATGINSLKVGHNNILGYYIEITAKNAQKILKDIQEGSSFFIHRQTLLNAVRFTTTELAELETKMRSAGEKALELELSFFSQLVENVLKQANSLATTAHMLAILDVASSLGDIADEMNYVRPVLDNSLAFDVQKGRHPVIEKALCESHDHNFIANDCSLGVDEKSGRLWLLTGPNMAGKSTFLRQNALIAVLAQSGCFVPADFARIGLIDKLFSRVGASDDLARGRSTFMVEMVETAAILNRASERSFVILDEIGRGTATYDGLSIAWAVVEYLHETNKSRALFATHYHELTALAERMSHLALYTMRVKEWDNNVVFLHEVVSGSVDRSYGIHVGKLAGLPSKVITRAKQVLTQLEKKGSYEINFMNDLPLFAHIPARQEEEKTKPLTENNPVLEKLKAVHPDDLSPKEALETLYQLKDLLSK